MSDLHRHFSPEVVALIEALVAERVEQAVARIEPAKRWLTVREAGDYLGVSDRAVYARIRRCRIPASAIRHQGRSVLLDRDALDRALDRSA